MMEESSPGKFKFMAIGGVIGGVCLAAGVSLGPGSVSMNLSVYRGRSAERSAECGVRSAECGGVGLNKK